MPRKQGDVSLLLEPVAQQLLQSKNPAYLAYNWSDGTPRVIPIGFHWNGEEIVMATVLDSPKMKVLKDGSRVAVSIDHNTMPPKILTIRGRVRVDTVEGLAPEYVAMIRRTMSKEEGEALLKMQLVSILSRHASLSVPTGSDFWTLRRGCQVGLSARLNEPPISTKTKQIGAAKSEQSRAHEHLCSIVFYQSRQMLKSIAG